MDYLIGKLQSLRNLNVFHMLDYLKDSLNPPKKDKAWNASDYNLHHATADEFPCSKHKDEPAGNPKDASDDTTCGLVDETKCIIAQFTMAKTTEAGAHKHVSEEMPLNKSQDTCATRAILPQTSTDVMHKNATCYEKRETLCDTTKDISDNAAEKRYHDALSDITTRRRFQYASSVVPVDEQEEKSSDEMNTPYNTPTNISTNAILDEKMTGNIMGDETNESICNVEKDLTAVAVENESHCKIPGLTSDDVILDQVKDSMLCDSPRSMTDVERGLSKNGTSDKSDDTTDNVTSDHLSDENHEKIVSTYGDDKGKDATVCISQAHGQNDIPTNTLGKYQNNTKHDDTLNRAAVGKWKDTNVVIKHNPSHENASRDTWVDDHEITVAKEGSKSSDDATVDTQKFEDVRVDMPSNELVRSIRNGGRELSYTQLDKCTPIMLKHVSGVWPDDEISAVAGDRGVSDNIVESKRTYSSSRFSPKDTHGDDIESISRDVPWDSVDYSANVDTDDDVGVIANKSLQKITQILGDKMEDNVSDAQDTVSRCNAFDRPTGKTVSLNLLSEPQDTSDDETEVKLCNDESKSLARAAVGVPHDRIANRMQDHRCEDILIAKADGESDKTMGEKDSDSSDDSEGDKLQDLSACIMQDSMSGDYPEDVARLELMDSSDDTIGRKPTYAHPDLATNDMIDDVIEDVSGDLPCDLMSDEAADTSKNAEGDKHRESIRDILPDDVPGGNLAVNLGDTETYAHYDIATGRLTTHTPDLNQEFKATEVLEDMSREGIKEFRCNDGRKYRGHAVTIISHEMTSDSTPDCKLVDVPQTMSCYDQKETISDEVRDTSDDTADDLPSHTLTDITSESKHQDEHEDTKYEDSEETISDEVRENTSDDAADDLPSHTLTDITSESKQRNEHEDTKYEDSEETMSDEVRDTGDDTGYPLFHNHTDITPDGNHQREPEHTEYVDPEENERDTERRCTLQNTSGHTIHYSPPINVQARKQVNVSMSLQGDKTEETMSDNLSDTLYYSAGNKPPDIIETETSVSIDSSLESLNDARRYTKSTMGRVTTHDSDTDTHQSSEEVILHLSQRLNILEEMVNDLQKRFRVYSKHGPVDSPGQCSTAEQAQQNKDSYGLECMTMEDSEEKGNDRAGCTLDSAPVEAVFTQEFNRENVRKNVLNDESAPTKSETWSDPRDNDSDDRLSLPSKNLMSEHKLDDVPEEKPSARTIINGTMFHKMYFSTKNPPGGMSGHIPKTIFGDKIKAEIVQVSGDTLDTTIHTAESKLCVTTASLMHENFHWTVSTKNVPHDAAANTSDVPEGSAKHITAFGKAAENIPQDVSGKIMIKEWTPLMVIAAGDSQCDTIPDEAQPDMPIFTLAIGLSVVLEGHVFDVRLDIFAIGEYTMHFRTKEIILISVDCFWRKYTSSHSDDFMEEVCMSLHISKVAQMRHVYIRSDERRQILLKPLLKAFLLMRHARINGINSCFLLGRTHTTFKVNFFRELYWQTTSLNVHHLRRPDFQISVTYSSDNENSDTNILEPIDQSNGIDSDTNQDFDFLLYQTSIVNLTAEQTTHLMRTVTVLDVKKVCIANESRTIGYACDEDFSKEPTALDKDRFAAHHTSIKMDSNRKNADQTHFFREGDPDNSDEAYEERVEHESIAGNRINTSRADKQDYTNETFAFQAGDGRLSNKTEVHFVNGKITSMITVTTYLDIHGCANEIRIFGLDNEHLQNQIITLQVDKNTTTKAKKARSNRTEDHKNVKEVHAYICETRCGVLFSFLTGHSSENKSNRLKEKSNHQTIDDQTSSNKTTIHQNNSKEFIDPTSTTANETSVRILPIVQLSADKPIYCRSGNGNMTNKSNPHSVNDMSVRAHVVSTHLANDQGTDIESCRVCNKNISRQAKPKRTFKYRTGLDSLPNENNKVDNECAIGCETRSHQVDVQEENTNGDRTDRATGDLIKDISACLVDKERITANTSLRSTRGIDDKCTGNDHCIYRVADQGNANVICTCFARFEDFPDKKSIHPLEDDITENGQRIHGTEDRIRAIQSSKFTEGKGERWNGDNAHNDNKRNLTTKQISTNRLKIRCDAAKDMHICRANGEDVVRETRTYPAQYAGEKSSIGNEISTPSVTLPGNAIQKRHYQTQDRYPSNKTTPQVFDGKRKPHRAAGDTPYYTISNKYPKKMPISPLPLRQNMIMHIHKVEMYLDTFAFAVYEMHFKTGRIVVILSDGFRREPFSSKYILCIEERSMILNLSTVTQMFHDKRRKNVARQILIQELRKIFQQAKLDRASVNLDKYWFVGRLVPQIESLNVYTLIRSRLEASVSPFSDNENPMNKIRIQQRFDQDKTEESDTYQGDCVNLLNQASVLLTVEQKTAQNKIIANFADKKCNARVNRISDTSNEDPSNIASTVGNERFAANNPNTKHSKESRTHISRADDLDHLNKGNAESTTTNRTNTRGTGKQYNANVKSACRVGARSLSSKTEDHPVDAKSATMLTMKTHTDNNSSENEKCIYGPDNGYVPQTIITSRDDNYSTFIDRADDHRSVNGFQIYIYDSSNGDSFQHPNAHSKDDVDYMTRKESSTHRTNDNKINSDKTIILGCYNKKSVNYTCTTEHETSAQVLTDKGTVNETINCRSGNDNTSDKSNSHTQNDISVTAYVFNTIQKSDQCVDTETYKACNETFSAKDYLEVTHKHRAGYENLPNETNTHKVDNERTKDCETRSHRVFISNSSNNHTDTTLDEDIINDISACPDNKERSTTKYCSTHRMDDKSTGNDNHFSRPGWEGLMALKANTFWMDDQGNVIVTFTFLPGFEDFLDITSVHSPDVIDIEGCIREAEDQTNENDKSNYREGDRKRRNAKSALYGDEETLTTNPISANRMKHQCNAIAFRISRANYDDILIEIRFDLSQHVDGKNTTENEICTLYVTLPRNTFIESISANTMSIHRGGTLWRLIENRSDRTVEKNHSNEAKSTGYPSVYPSMHPVDDKTTSPDEKRSRRLDNKETSRDTCEDVGVLSNAEITLGHGTSINIIRHLRNKFPTCAYRADKDNCKTKTNFLSDTSVKQVRDERSASTGIINDRKSDKGNVNVNHTYLAGNEELYLGLNAHTLKEENVTTNQTETHGLGNQTTTKSTCSCSSYSNVSLTETNIHNVDSKGECDTAIQTRKCKYVIHVGTVTQNTITQETLSFRAGGENVSNDNSTQKSYENKTANSRKDSRYNENETYRTDKDILNNSNTYQISGENTTANKSSIHRAYELSKAIEYRMFQAGERERTDVQIACQVLLGSTLANKTSNLPGQNVANELSTSSARGKNILHKTIIHSVDEESTTANISIGYETDDQDNSDGTHNYLAGNVGHQNDTNIYPGDMERIRVNAMCTSWVDNEHCSNKTLAHRENYECLSSDLGSHNMDDDQDTTDVDIQERKFRKSIQQPKGVSRENNLDQSNFGTFDNSTINQSNSVRLQENSYCSSTAITRPSNEQDNSRKSLFGASASQPRSRSPLSFPIVTTPIPQGRTIIRQCTDAPIGGNVPTDHDSSFINTCPLDSYLTMIYTSLHDNEDLRNDCKHSSDPWWQLHYYVYCCIRCDLMDKTREIWLQFMSCEKKDLFGTEHDMIHGYVKSKCKQPDHSFCNAEGCRCYRLARETGAIRLFNTVSGTLPHNENYRYEMMQNLLDYESNHSGRIAEMCDVQQECENMTNVEYRFPEEQCARADIAEPPLFLTIDLRDVREDLGDVQALPENVLYNGYGYRLAGATLHTNRGIGHFTAMVVQGGERWRYNNGFQGLKRFQCQALDEKLSYAVYRHDRNSIVKQYNC